MVASCTAGGKARLGLQIEYRATVSGLARALRSQLEAAAGDLQGRGAGLLKHTWLCLVA